MPSKKYHVDLTETEQVFLAELIQKRSLKSQVVKRAFVLQAADRNGDKVWKDQQIASTYGVRRKTVENIRQRFVEEGFEVCVYGKKSEYTREKIFTGDVEAHLVALRCSAPPLGHTRWTFRLLSDKMVELAYVPHMSAEGARQLLKKTKLSLGK